MALRNYEFFATIQRKYARIRNPATYRYTGRSKSGHGTRPVYRSNTLSIPK